MSNSASCCWKITIKNNDGEIVESKLFNDLLKISNNDREWTKTQYKIATNNDFIKDNLGDLEFDKNGQVTAHSFLRVAKLDYKLDKQASRLNKTYGKTVNTESVIDNVELFNQNEPLVKDFIPVLEEVENSDLTKISIQPRNDERVELLEQYINNTELLKLIKTRLKSLGVAYDFIGKNKEYKGRFSTKNAEKAADDLYHLIEIADDADVEDVFVEEAAHFATLACKDTDLINRLLSSITEKNINSLFTEEELSHIDLGFSQDSKLELAGVLVAKALKNQAPSNYRTLFGKIKDMIKNIFSKLEKNIILSDKQRAKIIADSVARGFLRGDNYDVLQALSECHVLNATKHINQAQNLYLNTVNELKSLGVKINNINSSIFNSVYKDPQIDYSSLDNKDDASRIDDAEAIGLIGNAVEALLDRLNIVYSEFSDIKEDFMDRELSVDMYNKIYEASEICDSLLSIYGYLGQAANDFKDTNKLIDLNEIINIKNSISDIVKGKIKPYLAGLLKLITAKELKEEFGAGIVLSAEVRLRGLNPFNCIEISDEKEISIDTLANYYIDELTDRNPIVNFFRTNQNKKDITTQLFYKKVREAKTVEALDYNNLISELRQLEDDCKTFGIDVKDFYDKSDDGVYSGYFIGETRYGEVARQDEIFTNKLKRKFKQHLEDTGELANFNMLGKGAQYSAYIEFVEEQPEFEEYSRLFEKDENGAYLNPQFRNLEFIKRKNSSDEEDVRFMEFYNKVRDYKRKIDLNYLSDYTEEMNGVESSTHGDVNMVPQYSAGFINRLRAKYNLRKTKDLYDARFIKDFCADPTSGQFGSKLTNNFWKEIRDEKHTKDDYAHELRKLPLTGINKLYDLRNLSDDLFGSLATYTEMACRFNTSQKVLSRLELFNKGLSLRNIDEDGNMTTSLGMTKSDVEKSSNRSNNNREDILRNILYVNPDNRKNKYLKAAQNAAAMVGTVASIRALCISPIAGLKNYIAGNNVIQKDIASGLLDVDASDVADAFSKLKMNPSHLVGSVYNSWLGEPAQFDKVQKLIHRWDSFRNPSKINYRKGLVPLQVALNVIMSNYGITDEALIGKIYWMKMHNKKLYQVPYELQYNEDGNTYVVWSKSSQINATEPYKYTQDNTPVLLSYVIKDSNDEDLFKYLTNARIRLNDAIAKNNDEGSSNVSYINLTAKDISDYTDLENYISSNNNYKSKYKIDLFNDDNSAVSCEQALDQIQTILDDIMYGREDEFNLCYDINEYILSSQGVYGLMDATEFQKNAYTKTLGKIKGYLFGLIQRNLFTNASLSLSEKKVSDVFGDEMVTYIRKRHSSFASEFFALSSLFFNSRNFNDNELFKDKMKFKRSMLYLMTVPFASQNKELMKMLQKKGWDPDQLNRVSFLCISAWYNLLLQFLARSLYKGNDTTYGENFSTKKKVKHKTPGILFKLSNLISFNEEQYNKDYNNWKKRGWRDTNRKDSLKRPKDSELWEAKNNALILKNNEIDKSSPLYYIYGAAYRLTKGVLDENYTQSNLPRFITEVVGLAQLDKSIVVSGGLSILLDGLFSSLEGDPDKFAKKELNFYLRKIGFQYDWDEEKLVPLDWYRNQDQADYFRTKDLDKNFKKIYTPVQETIVENIYDKHIDQYK